MLEDLRRIKEYCANNSCLDCKYSEGFLNCDCPFRISPNNWDIDHLERCDDDE